MIVKMKKISVVMFDSDRKQNVNQLEELGLLHVETRKNPGEEYAELKNRRSILAKALALLPADEKDKNAGQKTDSKSVSLDTAYEYSKRIIAKNNELKQTTDHKKQLLKFIEGIEIWGDFLPEDLESFKSYGVNIRLGSVPVKKLKQFGEYNEAVVLGRNKKQAFLVLLDEKPALENEDNFTPYEIPDKSLSMYRKELRDLESTLIKIQQELYSLHNHRAFLVESLAYLDRKLEFSAVYHSMAEDGELAVSTGYAPLDKTGKIEAFARKAGWALMISDPDPEDNVPTLVRNKKAIGIIKPVFSLMGTVPGYRENDISFMFLLFFSLFFAMIIGDGAYGMIILLSSLTGIIVKAIRRQPVPDTLFLLLVMGFTTVIWGTVTGTWFGSKELSMIPWLKQFVIDSIYSHNQNSEENVKYFCFILGTVHITIAHLWNIIKGIRQRIGLKIVAQFGWLSLVIGLFWLVLNLVLDAEKFKLPVYAMPMIIGGIGAVILFGNQEGNFFKGIAKGFSGLITTVLDGIGSFSDIISYIRLFAVGLASVEIAKSFNAMAQAAGASFPDGTIYRIIIPALILFAGHTLNLGMGALSVIVHGVRLNMLEFSGHLGMEWTGFEYKPFGRKEII
jgi:V/A-type H+/Na+-transporting ATPase subunit I